MLSTKIYFILSFNKLHKKIYPQLLPGPVQGPSPCQNTSIKDTNTYKVANKCNILCLQKKTFKDLLYFLAPLIVCLFPSSAKVIWLPYAKVCNIFHLTEGPQLFNSLEQK